MKRFTVVLALLLVLPVFMCSQVTPADVVDFRTVDEDHPWGGESGDDPGRYRHGADQGDLVLTSCAPLDIIINSGLLYKQIVPIFTNPKTDDSNLPEPETVYTGGITRRASFR